MRPRLLSFNMKEIARNKLVNKKYYDKQSNNFNLNLSIIIIFIIGIYFLYYRYNKKK
jgi:hypothetical protein